MAEPSDPPPGLFASLKKLWRGVLATANNRLELLLVELEEERRRAIALLLLVLAVGVLGLMTLLAGSVLLVTVFCDEHRVAVLAGLALFYLLAMLAGVWRLRVRLNNFRFLPDTVEQLKKDRACWEDKA
jgi:uncharacterized membrane protein YqjE